MEQLGYVYSFWSGEMTCEACVIVNKAIPCRTYAKARFIHKGGCIGVHHEPKKIYNGIVWLEDKDDALGACILIQHNQQQIEKLQQTIKKHEYKIQVLKEVYGGKEEEF